MAGTENEKLQYLNPDTRTISEGTIGEITGKLENLLQSNVNEENIANKVDNMYIVIYGILTVINGINDRMNENHNDVISEIKLTREFFGQETQRIDKSVSAFEGRLHTKIGEFKESSDANQEALRNQMTLILNRLGELSARL